MEQEAGNIIDEIFKKNIEELNAAKKKYEPLVKNSTDMEFAALWNVVLEERTRRMTRLMLENPLILRAEMERIAQEARDGDN